MFALRRRLPLAGLCSALIILAACGGGSSMRVAPMAPLFTSTPPTAATQDTAYSYQIAASDPSGGSVTFALSTAPAGAALSGSSLAWTPPATQSRIANSFTVTATTSEGGTATQSWMVTPNGTITVNWVETNWTENGPVQTPISGNEGLLALVPQSDGSLLALPGPFVSPGVVNILNVPAGYFWLTRSPLHSSGIWTSSSTIDLGQDKLGTPVGGPNSPNTIFNFNLAGLAPLTSQGELEALTDTFEELGVFAVPPGSTTLTANVNIPEGPNWADIDTAFLLQYEPVSLGSFNELVLGPELTLSNLALTDGTNNISGTLQASPQTSVNLSIPGTQWVAPLASVGPTGAALQASYLSLTAEPYISGGRNAAPDILGPDLPLMMPAHPNPPPLGSDWCLNGSFQIFGALPVSEAPVADDINLGAVAYGDPFPSAWTRALAFCQLAVAPVTVPGFDWPVPFGLLSGEAMPPSTAPDPLAPLAGPVQNPTINGASLFAAATLNSTVVSLSWTAPAGSTPYGYMVVPIQVQTNGNSVELSPVGEFLTGKTSTTLPPLTAGNMYLFVIMTLVDAAANVETNPYRSALPTAFTAVVSAPIMVSSGANSPTIRGDAKAFAEMTRKRAESAPSIRYSAPTRSPLP